MMWKLVPASIVLKETVVSGTSAFPLCFPLSLLINASRPLPNDLLAGNVCTKLKRSRSLVEIVYL